ncbi:MAG: TetR/AcrR family transcriptional regulator [Halopseudomonas aestusnigri]
MSQKKDKRKVQSEKAIIEAGIKVLISNSSASLTDIAAAAGIGRATMYRHFDTREALIRTIARICLEDVEAALEPIADLRGKMAFEDIFNILVPLGDRYHFLTQLWRLVEQDEEWADINTQQIDDLKMLIDDAKTIGDIKTELPTVWVSTFFESTLYAAWELVQSEGIPASDAAKFAQHSFFKGCEK